MNTLPYKIQRLINMQDFDLDFDDYDQPITNNSALVSQNLQAKNKDKYTPHTVTKGFFNQEQLQYQQSQSISSPKKQQHKKEDESSRRRRKKGPLKLEPLKQGQKVEVFQNANRDAEQNQVQQYDFSLDKPQPKVEQVEKPVIQKRRRPKNLVFMNDSEEEEQEQQEQPEIKPRAPRFVEQNQRNNEEEELNETSQALSVPANRNILNQFQSGSEDEEDIEAAPQLNIQSSNYFKYNIAQEFKRQLTESVKPNSLLRMELVRDKSGFNTFWPQFHLYFNSDSHYVISAKKTSSKPSSTFILSTNKTNYQQNSPYYLGKMKSNVMGDILNIFGPGLNPSNAKDKNQIPRELIATIVYSSNLFQMGKPRQFFVYVKNPGVKYYQAFPQVRVYQEQIPLHSLYEHPENRKKITIYNNRKPQWIEHLGGYMLNFRGRVQTPSIKNFILETKEGGEELIIFGKVNESKFNLDMMNPISPLIAFGIALSSFDSRIMCQ